MLLHIFNHVTGGNRAENRAQIDVGMLPEPVLLHNLRSPIQIIHGAAHKLYRVLLGQQGEILKMHGVLHATGGKLIVHGEGGAAGKRQIWRKVHTAIGLYLYIELRIPAQKGQKLSNMGLDHGLAAGDGDILTAALLDQLVELGFGEMGTGGIGGLRPLGVAVVTAEVAACQADKEGQLTGPGAFAIDAQKGFRYIKAGQSGAPPSRRYRRHSCWGSRRRRPPGASAPFPSAAGRSSG